jgi:hypothetical protein
MTRDEILQDVEWRLSLITLEEILKVLTDPMFWENEGPAWSCTEAEAIAAAAVHLGASTFTMSTLVVDGHGQPARSEDEGDLHYHEEEA